MTSEKQMFIEMNESVRSQVKMGDNNQVQVKGRGVVSVSTKSGNKLIHNVMYVPGLAQNLISLGQLMEMGY